MGDIGREHEEIHRFEPMPETAPVEEPIAVPVPDREEVPV